jgi:hypothetical protein
LQHNLPFASFRHWQRHHLAAAHCDMPMGHERPRLASHMRTTGGGFHLPVSASNGGA